jgi:hypothetical protein
MELRGSGTGVGSGLAVVRSLGMPRRLRNPAEFDDFEQELVDQWVLALAGAGLSDSHVAGERAAVVEFVRFVGRPLWTVRPDDADRWLRTLRVTESQARTTIKDKAQGVARFYSFLIARYQGDIHALTGAVIGQPIDEFNRPGKADYGTPRVPPAEEEIDTLFTAWRESLPTARKYLPAARAYLAASLWRRVGLRINETAMLDIRDWRPDLGPSGKLHVRYGKGSYGRGPKARLVPGINAVDELLTWWLTDVRHQFDDDWDNPDAPLLPSERRDPDTGPAHRPGERRHPMVARLGHPRKAADPARPAALLRLVDVCPRRGPEGHPGTAGPLVAVDHHAVHPRPRRPHRAGLEPGQPAAHHPPDRRMTLCNGTCA